MLILPQKGLSCEVLQKLFWGVATASKAVHTQVNIQGPSVWT